MDKKDIKVRVIKGNWRTNEILYLSEPLTVEEAFQRERELVPSLAPRGSGDSILIKFCEDRGEVFDYMTNHGGWMIYTHREKTF